MSKYIEYIFNALTGETEIIERDFTPEELEEQKRQILQLKIQDIEMQLSELDNIVSREYEDMYESFRKLITQGVITSNPLYWDDKKQDAVNKKIELRNILKSL